MEKNLINTLKQSFNLKDASILFLVIWLPNIICSFGDNELFVNFFFMLVEQKKPRKLISVYAYMFKIIV